MKNVALGVAPFLAQHLRSQLALSSLNPRTPLGTLLGHHFPDKDRWKKAPVPLLSPQLKDLFASTFSLY